MSEFRDLEQMSRIAQKPGVDPITSVIAVVPGPDLRELTDNALHSELDIANSNAGVAQDIVDRQRRLARPFRYLAVGIATVAFAMAGGKTSDIVEYNSGNPAPNYEAQDPTDTTSIVAGIVGGAGGAVLGWLYGNAMTGSVARARAKTIVRKAQTASR